MKITTRAKIEEYRVVEGSNWAPPYASVVLVTLRSIDGSRWEVRLMRDQVAGLHLGDEATLTVEFPTGGPQ